MTSGLTAMISRKIQRPVISAMPAPVTIGSRPRHQLMRLRRPSTSLGRGASTEARQCGEGCAELAGEHLLGSAVAEDGELVGWDVEDRQDGAAGVDVGARLDLGFAGELVALDAGAVGGTGVGDGEPAVAVTVQRAVVGREEGVGEGEVGATAADRDRSAARQGGFVRRRGRRRRRGDGPGGRAVSAWPRLPQVIVGAVLEPDTGQRLRRSSRTRPSNPSGWDVEALVLERTRELADASRRLGVDERVVALAEPADDLHPPGGHAGSRDER